MKKVSIVRYDESSNAVKNAIDLCDGFKELSTDSTVLLKPNIVWGGGLMRGVPKYGFITTSRIIEDIIIALLHYGCKASNIKIGEGTIVNKELQSSTSGGYKWSGIKKVAKKYGVSLIDFNKDTFETLENKYGKYQIASSALDSDFFINVPVMKTHFMTGVSLGMKNLKGCMHPVSKKQFHTSKKLKEKIAALNFEFHNLNKPNLTIIDGIYSLEGGPSPNGTAHRTNLIIAGKDPLSVDLIGAKVMGIKSSEVQYFKDYSKISGRSLSLKNIEVKGEKIKDVALSYKHKVDYNEIFKKMNIKGISIKDAGDTLCTGCVTGLEAAIIVYGTDNYNTTMDKKIEICSASAVTPDNDSDIVFLFGDCSCHRNNKSIGKNKDRKIIPIKGCTPYLTTFLIHFYKETLPKKKFLSSISKRMLKSAGTTLNIVNEDLLRKGYTKPDFDENHFVNKNK